MFRYLPTNLQNLIKNEKEVIEIRLRINNYPIIFTNSGVKIYKNIKITYLDLENIISVITKNSIYSYEEDIKNGFITTNNGERIGFCGEFVFNNGKIVTIKKFTSLCIRVPNIISGVSNDFLNLYKGGSVLVISKSGVGKTTFIRDLALNLSQKNNNIVVIDERNELFSKINNLDNYNYNLDVLTYATKEYGLNEGVRSLNPNYLITDELMDKNDLKNIVKAKMCGVNIIASMHASSFLEGVKRLKIMLNMEYKLFDYYVYISFSNNKRVYKYYNVDFNEI